MGRIICWLFGHKTIGNFFNGREYMKIVNVITDGVGREHAQLAAECPRCMSIYRAGKVHIPPEFVRVESAASKAHVPSEEGKGV